ncbi:MAG TPA: hypothetical protein VHB70_12185 [Parafilimonas sp.]|nr:hypothetical protein [Parafilimonas sp.]
MKIKVWLITIIALLLVACLIFFPITVTYTDTIASNFDNTYRHLNNLNEWQKWNPGLIKICSEDCEKRDFKNGKIKGVTFNHANDSIVITKPIPLLYNVNITVHDNFASYNLLIVPSASTNSIEVKAFEKVKLFNYIFSGRNSSNAQSALNGLKRFLEDTKNVYGFRIEGEKVKDTVFAVYDCATDSANLFATINKNFKLVDNYIQQHHLEKKGFYSISYSAAQDSLHLILGIAVNKFAEPVGEVHCVEIPKGKMLTGFYNGRFCDKLAIYRAFIHYATDHYEENVGASFESYTDNKLPTSDTSTVQFKFYYPVLN